MTNVCSAVAGPRVIACSAQDSDTVAQAGILARRVQRLTVAGQRRIHTGLPRSLRETQANYHAAGGRTTEAPNARWSRRFLTVCSARRGRTPEQRHARSPARRAWSGVLSGFIPSGYGDPARLF